MTRFHVFPQSVLEHETTTYALILAPGTIEKRLLIQGDASDFTGESDGDVVLCALSADNARALRQRLPWMNPVPLGLKRSAGFGDRLGIATPGHILAVQGTGMAPIFAQQSVRENQRTGRTPQQVVDDAMWGVLQGGWRHEWGADADHLKTPDQIAPFVQAGYSFFTIDPGDYVTDVMDKAAPEELAQQYAALPWDVLASTPDETQNRYADLTVDLGTSALQFSVAILHRAAVKYGRAIAHVFGMAREIHRQMGALPFDLEISVDETNEPTSWHEHYFIANELRRLGVNWVSLAPRFVGRFEKGVDYIGDLALFEQDVQGHMAIVRYFGSSYKLSIHTGSDKFSIYPVIYRHTGDLVHLKTAGTSYLEALRVMAAFQPGAFRQVLDFARQRYAIDRQTYHVSAQLARVPEPAALTDEQLPALLDEFDARQVLHVTFGSVLDQFGTGLDQLLQEQEAAYHAGLKRHFDLHLSSFQQH